jgi:hypothetical protein
MAAMRATISGRVGGRVLRSAEVSAATYDRYRELKAIWKFDCDQMVDLATDGGRLPLNEDTVLELLGRMERDAVEMGARLTTAKGP